MAQYVLEILDGDRAGEVLPVAERALRIGRKPTNDVVLSDEKTSGVHAEVVPEGDRHVLRDLGSTNGTFLDGKRVTEVVLTPGDVVTVGRLRVKFRSAEEGAAATTGGEFAMHRLDAGRVKKGSSAAVLLGLLVLVGGGAGGWFWWQGRQQNDPEQVVQTKKAIVAVAGNKLAGDVASCEGEAGWSLRAAGRGFAVVGGGNTGSASLEASRDGDGDDFALATLTEPVQVFAGRPLQLAAFVRTQGNAQVGVRCLMNSSSDANPLHFRVGTPLQQAASWQRIEVSVQVPAGCDRVQVELCAVLPDNESSARVDDVALVEGGDAKGLEHTMAEGSQILRGTGTALAIKSFDAENPVALYEIAPGDPAAAMRGLAAASLLALSDIGATLQCTPSERSVQIAATGTGALEFVFPAEAAAQLALQAAADGPFEPTTGEFAAPAASLLIGSRATRAQLTFASPVACKGRVANGLFHVTVATASLDLVLGFRAERMRAENLLRDARKADGENRPGDALDVLRELQHTAPHDTETLGLAATLRTTILGRQADAVQKLGSDFTENRVFDTRGGYERVVDGLDQIVQLYGERNLDNKDAVRDLRAQAAQKLAALDATRIESAKQKLTDLAKAFADAGQPGLAELVQDYLKRNP